MGYNRAGNLEGWINLKKTRTQIVPKKMKPNGTCSHCGMDVFFIKVFLKYSSPMIAFEEDPISSQMDYGKKLFNHKNMSQSRFSCIYSKFKRINNET